MSAPMRLEDEDVARVRRSFAAVLRDADGFSRRLYERLFEVAPAVRPLFSRDLERQREKLVASLAVVVQNAGKLEQLDNTLRDLGVRHIDYGAEAAHYVVLGDVLIEVLGERLGADFDAETEDAWRRFYDAVAVQMQP